MDCIRRVASGALAGALLAPLAQAQVSPPPLCTQPPVWTAPFDVGVALRGDVPAAVAASDNGEAMVVWYGPTTTGARAVQTRRFASVQSLLPAWQAPVTARIIKGPLDTTAIDVAMDGSGSALAVWETGDQRIEAARFARASNGTGQWDNAKVLSAASDAASAPVVAVRRDGKVGIALWQAVAGNRRSLHWASFDALTGAWTSAAAPLAGNAEEDFAPSLAFSADGFALLAYQYITGSATAATRRVRVFGQWYDPSSQTWSKPATLSDATGTVTPWATPLVPQPRVVIDGDGQGLAVWRYRDPLGGCEQVRAKDFDGASKAWSSVTQGLSGCIDPLPEATPLKPVSNVLGAAIAPLNARTTFVLWARNTVLGAYPEVRMRVNAGTPWAARQQLPQPVVGHSIAIGDAAFAGSSEPSALWAQPQGIASSSGHGLYVSNHAAPSGSCPQWSAPQKIADVGGLRPLLRTPARAGLPIAVWLDLDGQVPHVYASLRRSRTGLILR